MIRFVPKGVLRYAPAAPVAKTPMLALSAAISRTAQAALAGSTCCIAQYSIAFSLISFSLISFSPISFSSLKHSAAWHSIA